MHRSPLAVIVLGLAVVSACTTQSPGEPQPATTVEETSPPGSSSPGEDGSLPFAGAPKVDDPLDTSRYEQDPCLSLTASQTGPLNLPSVGTIDNKVALGIGCNWFNEETRGEVSIRFLVDDPRGLSPEYEANNQGKREVFEKLPEIEGYPAVIRTTSDHQEIGHCTVVVGVADDMAFESVVQLSQSNVGKKDPCEVAVEVAGLALQTMKGA